MRFYNIKIRKGMMSISSICLCISILPCIIFASAGTQQTVNQLNNKVNNALGGNAASMAADSIRNEAFAGVPDTLMPMNPDEIKHVRRIFNRTQQAGAFTGDVPAKPVSSTIMVDISPGASPPVVRLSSGFVSSLVFLDSSGAPWPIKAYDLGDPKSFNIQWSQSGGEDSIDNTLMIQAITMYKVANLAVVLKGLNTPIMLTLVPGQEVVDYRVDIRAPGLGPKARPTYNMMPASASSVLIDILNGIAPEKAKQLTVKGSNASAWLVDKTMYVRTDMTVVSPSWISTMSGSEGGVNAYELPQSSVVLALKNGKVNKLQIEGF
ncbi:MAG: type IV secretion protein IcmK [Legionellales bacterium]|jgi:intracellular multiplication protein IcmK|nr:type IV secretion protein IcmK [Legionellales bacterium]